MNIIDPHLLEILHKWKRKDISREAAQTEINKYLDTVIVQLYDGGFSIRHNNIEATQEVAEIPV